MKKFLSGIFKGNNSSWLCFLSFAFTAIYSITGDDATLIVSAIFISSFGVCSAIEGLKDD